MRPDATATMCGMTRNLPANVASIFDKNIIIEYYDGLVSGALRCFGSSSTFRYELVDWDNRKETRVFGLAYLPEDVFRRLVVLTETPHEWTRERYEEAEELLHRHSNFQFAVFINLDSDMLTAYFELTKEERIIVPGSTLWSDDFQSVDWFATLGIGR